MLDPQYCRLRQRRLAARLAEAKLDAAVLGAARHVQYVSGLRPFWLHSAAAVVRADGTTALVWANAEPDAPAVDATAVFIANRRGTLRQDQAFAVAEACAPLLRGAGAVGVDGSAVSAALALRRDAAWTDIEPLLRDLRRSKDADELALIERAVGACDAAYARARQAIEPGVSELRVFTEVQAALVHAVGEPMTALLGNDFRCGEPGGAPRADRVARDGELFILDLGPTCRGYFADTARTFAVNRRPTDAQRRAWEAVAGCFRVVESMARPGVRCREIVRAVDEHLRAAAGRGLPHHLGHGFGLEPHEAPHLNPEWDDALIEGETFTAEPGLYAPELAGGLRLENDYVVERGGVRSLLATPLDLG